MTVRELCARKELALTPVVLQDGDRAVVNGYAGDLLSWVMGRALSGEAWVTIMSNNNIVAVAALTDVSCIILSEGVQPDTGVADTARERGVNLLSSTLSTFELCAKLKALV